MSIETQKAAAQLTETWIRLTGEIYLPEFKRVLATGYAQEIVKITPELSREDVSALAQFRAEKAAEILSDTLLPELRTWANGFLKRAISRDLQEWNNEASAYGIDSHLITSMNKQFREELEGSVVEDHRKLCAVPKVGRPPKSNYEKKAAWGIERQELIRRYAAAIATLITQGKKLSNVNIAAIAYPGQKKKTAAVSLTKALSKYGINLKEINKNDDRSNRLLAGN